jgi:hypothetical protein
MCVDALWHAKHPFRLSKAAVASFVVVVSIESSLEAVMHITRPE